MPKFELAFIQATGFPPNAEIDFQSDSLGEVHNGKLKTNADGYTDTGILPFVKGKSKGKTEIRMTSSQCSPKVTFHWGTTTE